MIVSFLPLCKGCFLQCKSGKVATLELRDGLGSAKYNPKSEKVEFPAGVPKSRLPGNRRPKEGRKGLMFRLPACLPVLVGKSQEVDAPCEEFLDHELLVQVSYKRPVQCLAAEVSSHVTFFVDSGAGQSLCSVSAAFTDLQPCRIAVTGVSGSLPIFGCGTANFVALDHNGFQIAIKIPNCLYGRCEFNLLSVSQLNQVAGNRVDFSLDSPAMVLAPPPFDVGGWPFCSSFGASGGRGSAFRVSPQVQRRATRSLCAE
jgi:hypothetical protein